MRTSRPERWATSSTRIASTLPSAVFATPAALARQRRSSGLHGVDAVGLAVAATGLTVGPIDFHHRHPHAAQEAGQAGPVGAGALHPDPL